MIKEKDNTITYLIWILFALGALQLFNGCSSQKLAEEDAEKNKGKEVRAAINSPNPQDENGDEVNSEQETPSKNKSDAKEPTSAEFYNKFTDARKRHDSASANHYAGEILSRNPGDIRVLNSLAVMAIEQDKYDLARLYVDKVLVKDPNNGPAYNNLGVVELKTDNLRLALVQFKKATAFDGRNKAAHANLGAIYLKYRNYQNAAQELGEAVENGDQSPETLSNYGFALTGTGDYSGATKYYEKALSKEPNNISILLNYSALLVEKTHKYKEAQKHLNKIRFIAHEPVILGKVEILLKKAENPTAEKGVSQ